MAKKFLVPIDLTNLELLNAAVHNAASAPASPSVGQVYYNTTSKKLNIYDGAQWNQLEDSGGLSGVQSVTGAAPLSVDQTTGAVTVSISAATTSAAGSMSSTDKTKLDNATASNTNSTLVLRDGSGNFSAGTITAALTGSATQLGGQAGSYYLGRANHTGTQAASTISDLATTVKSYRLDEFAKPTNNIDLNSNRIVGLAAPVADGDAVNKSYVDAARMGLDAKESVRAATTGNITLSGTQTVDGVVLVAGDRVLVKDQTDKKTNGIYDVVGGAGAWTRSPDAVAGKLNSGAYVFVEEGTANDNSGWVLSTPEPITVGTTNIDFVQFSGTGQIIAGNGIDKIGNTISAKGTANRISVSASGIDIASNYVGQSTITTLGTITTGTWNGTTIAVNKGGTGITSYTANNYIRASGATTLEQRTPANVLSDIGAVAANGAITGATKTKITYDSKGLVTAGADLIASDIPALDAAKITTGTFLIGRIPTGTTSTTVSLGNHNHTLDSLTSVTISSKASNDVLQWNGTAWVNKTLAGAGISATGHTHSGADITSGTVDFARLPTGTGANEVAVGNHNHTFDSLSNVTISAKSTSDVVQWNGTAWVNKTLAGAGIAAASHTHDAGDITTGTLPVGRGGTGLSSITSNSFLKGNGTGALVQRTYAEVKTDLSLDNVENTKLSTWAGTSSITTLGTIGTGTWSATTIAVAKGGTGATTAAAARSNLGAPGKYVGNAGNSTSNIITHNLGTRDVTVTVYESASPYNVVECDVQLTSTTTLTLNFAVAPAASDTYKVVVVG